LRNSGSDTSFPSTSQNNGQITKQKDWVTGEEANYTYDTMQRLVTAQTTGPEWGLSFGYDGFGNKLRRLIERAQRISQCAQP